MTARAFRTALDWSPNQFGVNGVALNVAFNSNVIPFDGCNQIILDVRIVNATGAGFTTTTCFPQVRNHGDANWRSLMTKAIAAGVETCSVRQIVLPTTGAAGTFAFSYPTSIDGADSNEFRLATITGTGAGATDLIFIRCKVGYGD